MIPSISVICAAWQAAATLSETLASVRAQTVGPTEVVVVDDGSTDQTANVGVAARAKVVSTANAGPAAALNAGIAASCGELLAFIDADDLWPADKLAVQTDFLVSNPALTGVLGLVQCFLSPELELNIASRYRVPEERQNAWLLGALLIHRQEFYKVGGFDETIRAGFAIDWFDRARRLGSTFGMPKHVVLLRRIHPTSLSQRSPTRDAGYARMAWRALQRRRASEEAE